jgi:phosphoribosylanthranilate isomerase
VEQIIIAPSPVTNGHDREKRFPPYVGITGFSNINEIDNAIDNYYKYQKGKHLLMAGFLLSKSVIVNLSHPDPWKACRYPPLARIRKLLERANETGVIKTIHYHGKSEELFNDVSLLIDGMGWNGLVDAIQFNVNFPPDPPVINNIKENFPSIKLILAVDKNALSGMYSGDEIARLISRCNAEYILIDPSGGHGIAIDIFRAIRVHDAIEKKSTVRIGFAGGINNNNVRSIVKEIKRSTGNTDFCIDAESGLRDEENKLDLLKVDDYLKNFFREIG